MLFACKNDKSTQESDNSISVETIKAKDDKNVKAYVEPLKEYVNDILLLNYGKDVVNEYKYKNYEHKIVGSKGGGWYSSGPYSILTLTYETNDKNKLYVEFNDVESIDYIFKENNEYKFEKYPLIHNILFEDETVSKKYDDGRQNIKGDTSIYSIEKQFISDNKNLNTDNNKKELVDLRAVNKGDKVLYGKFANNDLLWTVVNKSDGKLLLISDYCFDLKLDYRNEKYYDTLYLRALFTKEEYDNIEILRDDKHTGYKFFILDEEKFDNIFKTNEDRKVYGCFGDTALMGEKCYYMGKNGLYYESVNAVCETGEIYPAYDISTLPNRICMEVTADKVYTINKKDYNSIDFSYIDEILENKFKNSYAGNYERISQTYIDNKAKPIYQKNGFSHKLVRIGNDIKYVDANHIIHGIKEIDDYNDDFKIGDIIYFGKAKLSYQSSEEDNKYVSGRRIDDTKKMIYRIMDIKNGVALIHSVFSISDNGATVGKEGYADSSLREYLNNEFYNDSFSEYEKSLIMNTEISYYDYNAKKDLKFQDKVFTLQNRTWIDYYQNINTEDFILSPKSLEQEYIYMSDLPDSERIAEDGSIKYITYGKNRPVWFMTYQGSVTYGWSGISARDEKNIGFLPMLRIKLYDENISNVDDYYLPDFSYDNRLDRIVLNGDDLYFMDSDNNLYLVRGYKGESRVKASQVIKLGEKVGMIYKRDDDVYFFSNLNWRDNWNEEEGELFLSNKQVDKIALSDSVFARLFFDEDAMEFYVDGKLKKGEVVGKKYILKDGILTDYNGKSRNIFNSNAIVESKDDIGQDEEVIKDYKPIVVDRDTQKFKIKNSKGKFIFIPYTRDNKLYINYDDTEIELDEIYKDGYYEKPSFYYIDKYDAYYVIYSRKKTENTALRYLHRENDNIVLETVDEVAFDISKKVIYDGVFYYTRILHNGWAPDLSTFYSVEKNENPKEIKNERLSKYYFYNPKNASEFFINSSGDLVEIDKYGNRKVIEYYISDISYNLNGVVFSKEVDEEYKVFYYDLSDKHEVGFGNRLTQVTSMEAKDYYIDGRDVRVSNMKDLFVFDKKILESINNNPALVKEKFYKEVYDYLDKMKEYITILDLYHIDGNGAKKVDGEVEKRFECGDGYILYVKSNMFDFVKPIDEIYELMKFVSPDYVKSAEMFVGRYITYVKENTKKELYLYGNGKKHKITFDTDEPNNLNYVTTNRVKDNKLFISFNGNMFEVDITSNDILEAKLISKKVAHIIHTYDDGKLVFTRVYNSDDKLYDICTYYQGKIDVLVNKVKLYGDFEEDSTDIFKLFDNRLADKVYAIKYTKDGENTLITMPDKKVLAKNIFATCGMVFYE